METKLWNGERMEDLSAAAVALRQGQLVAFPTETVYGLGGNALDVRAAEKIYGAKGRPSDNPLIVHIYKTEQLAELAAEIPDAARALMAAFWPGPLTLIFPKKDVVPDCVTGGLGTVAVRMPDHPVALKLLQASDLPIAGPSANTSGKPSPTKAEHVWHDLHGKIAGIVDGGACRVGLESTVLDLTGTAPVILRPGAVTKEAIEEWLGPVEEAPPDISSKDAPRAPGMKYTHYAPEAPLYLCQGTGPQIASGLMKEISQCTGQAGLMFSAETLAAFPQAFLSSDAVVVENLGSRTDLEKVCARVFDALRYFDQTGVSIIYTEYFSTASIGAALMNRLHKAAGGQLRKFGCV